MDYDPSKDRDVWYGWWEGGPAKITYASRPYPALARFMAKVFPPKPYFWLGAEAEAHHGDR